MTLGRRFIIGATSPEWNTDLRPGMLWPCSHFTWGGLGKPQWPCQKPRARGQWAWIRRTLHFQAASLNSAAAPGQHITAQLLVCYGARGSCPPSTARCRWRCRMAQEIPSREENWTCALREPALLTSYLHTSACLGRIHLARSRVCVWVTLACLYGQRVWLIWLIMVVYFEIRKVPYRAYFFPLPVKPQIIYSYIYICPIRRIPQYMSWNKGWKQWEVLRTTAI